jgi:type II secretory pathway pseudopilin PulG
LIVVIAIIGVLAAILIPLLMNHVTSSRIQDADSDAATILRLIRAEQVRLDGRNQELAFCCVQRVVFDEMPTVVLRDTAAANGTRITDEDDITPVGIRLFTNAGDANFVAAADTLVPGITGVVIPRIGALGDTVNLEPSALDDLRDARNRTNIWGCGGTGQWTVALAATSGTEGCFCPTVAP